ncbi:hypothetical protein LCGC14_0262310 [marine sediment metagenome]|uniref:Uncharacterized protein n=1 Tax=marine sediment metagenome TaxID=412755 RepID=A0A0F9UHX2_9ZZZZ
MITKITLPRRRLLPGFWKLPRIDLPRVRIDYPEKVTPPWQELKVERVLFCSLKPDGFAVKVVFES